MSFTNPGFYLFFILVFLIYLFLKHKQQNLFLLAASYIFYVLWDWRFIFFLLIPSITDYYCSLMISRNSAAGKKKMYLAISLFVNLSILIFFKSFNFFISSLNQLLFLFGLDAYQLHLQVILPLGISFYTFKAMGYVIDVYRGEAKPIKFSDYLLFISFFPQLLAGPIERAKNFFPQIQNKRIISWSNIKTGCYLIYWGLFKKIFIANNCAALSASFFSNPSGISGTETLVYLYVFAFQLYCDISGYTDIARGTAKLMGFDLAINFRFPYFSRNISDFWSRWHMSLTYWFRDYVFFPVLAYSRGNAYLASFITLLCISLWHIISLNSILRGVYFGATVALFHFFKKKSSRLKPVSPNKIQQAAVSFFSWLVTFHLVCFGRIFFWPSGTENIVSILGKIFGDFNLSIFISLLWQLFAYISILLAVEIWQAVKRDEFILLKSNFIFKAAFFWITFWLLLGSRTSADLPFIYLAF